VKAEDVARRLQQREGVPLADFTEIGLPVYYLKLRAITLAHKKVPTINEFILRSLALEIASVPELSSYLGLEERVLRPSLVGLLRTSDVAVLPAVENKMFRLTQKGEGTLDRAESVITEERQFSIYFDALTRRVAWYRNFELLNYGAMKQRGMLEINQSPPVRPKIGDLRLSDINRVARAIYQTTDTKRDLLAIAAIESCQKLFIPAVALIYKNKHEQEALLGVAIDGKFSGEHEKVVSQNASFVRFLATQPPRYAPDTVLSSEAQESLLQASSQAEQIRSASSAAEVAIADTEEALSNTESVKEAESLRSRLRDLEEELVKLKNEAKVIPVRNIYVYDHPLLLQDALKSSIERLLIISPWITGQVVDADFLKDLEQLLKKGFRVYIGHGIAPDTRKNPHPNDAAAKAKLEALGRRFSNFKFIRLGNTHAKVLIKDHDFAAIGSFNWLSFKGDPSRTFRDEQGVLLQRKDLVDLKFDEVIQQFI
jgi:hypothetical protein